MLTRSQTVIKRETPGLNMLLNAIDEIERATKLATQITPIVEGMAMPDENAATDTIKEYIEVTKKVIDIPTPGAPKQGYVQTFDPDTNTWSFVAVNHTLKIDELIDAIDSQRFCFGDWQSDLESVMRGDCYNDSRLCEYIYNLEALVEHLKKD